MSEPESQPALTSQLAAECDMLRLRSAAHERTEAELRREVSDLRAALTTVIESRDRSLAESREASMALEEMRRDNANLREQVKMYKESLRLIQQLRREDG